MANEGGALKSPLLPARAGQSTEGDMWYLVLSRRVRTDEEREERLQPHRDWLDTQHRAGRVLFSGPITDGSYGVYVLLAENLEAAQHLAGEDPYHAYGDREPQVLEWNAHRALRLDGPSIAEIEAMASAQSVPRG